MANKGQLVFPEHLPDDKMLKGLVLMMEWCVEREIDPETVVVNLGFVEGGDVRYVREIRFSDLVKTIRPS